MSANGNGTSFVTVAGEMVAPPGAVGGGRAAGGDASLLVRKRTIRDLRAGVVEDEAALQAALDWLREADAQLAALGAEQQAVAAEREGAEADRVGAGKDAERLTEDARRASVFADTLRIEAAEVSVEATGVAAEIRSQRDELARIEADAAAAAAAVARLLAAIDADAARETACAQAFLQAQVDLAGLAGRIEAAESEQVRLEADEVETRQRLDGGGVRARPSTSAVARARRSGPGGSSFARPAWVASGTRPRPPRVSRPTLCSVTERLRGVTEEARGAEAELGRFSHQLPRPHGAGRRGPGPAAGRGSGGPATVRGQPRRPAGRPRAGSGRRRDAGPTGRARGPDHGAGAGQSDRRRGVPGGWTSG